MFAEDIHVVAIGAVSLVVGTAIWEVIRRGVQKQRYVNVFIGDRPLRRGSAMNSVDRKVLIDEDGRMAVPRRWQDGSLIQFYEASGRYVGSAILTEGKNREFEPIRLKAPNRHTRRPAA